MIFTHLIMLTTTTYLVESSFGAVAFHRSNKSLLPNVDNGTEIVEDNCYDVVTDTYKEVGFEWHIPKRCMIARCESYHSTLYISYSSCPSVSAEYPCQKVENPDLQYPFCCPRFVCETNKNLTIEDLLHQANETVVEFSLNEIDLGNDEDRLDALKDIHHKLEGPKAIGVSIPMAGKLNGSSILTEKEMSFDEVSTGVASNETDTHENMEEKHSDEENDEYLINFNDYDHYSYVFEVENNVSTSTLKTDTIQRNVSDAQDIRKEKQVDELLFDDNKKSTFASNTDYYQDDDEGLFDLSDFYYYSWFPMMEEIHDYKTNNKTSVENGQEASAERGNHSTEESVVGDDSYPSTILDVIHGSMEASDSETQELEKVSENWSIINLVGDTIVAKDQNSDQKDQEVQNAGENYFTYKVINGDDTKTTRDSDEPSAETPETLQTTLKSEFVVTSTLTNES